MEMINGSANRILSPLLENKSLPLASQPEGYHEMENDICKEWLHTHTQEGLQEQGK